MFITLILIIPKSIIIEKVFPNLKAIPQSNQNETDAEWMKICALAWTCAFITKFIKIKTPCRVKFMIFENL